MPLLIYRKSHRRQFANTKHLCSHPHPDTMKNNGWIVWLGTLALLLLHQDFWFWDNYETEVFGFMPIGLAYHAGFSIVAALWWGAVMSFAWPHHLEALAEEQEKPNSTQRS